MPKRPHTRPLPSICIDENLSPAVADEFRAFGYRVFEAAKHPRLRGRDERDFLPDLLRENAVFVTGDAEFVSEVIESPRPHPGIVLIDQRFSSEQKTDFARFAADGIFGRCADGPRAFAGRVAYVGVDGVRVVYRGKDSLVYSWAALDHRRNANPVQRLLRSRAR